MSIVRYVICFIVEAVGDAVNVVLYVLTYMAAPICSVQEAKMSIQPRSLSITKQQGRL